MKRQFFGLCLLLISSGAVHAAEAVWQGDLFMVATSSSCNPDTDRAGRDATYVHAVFKPAGVAQNGPDTKLAIHINGRAAFHFQWTNKSFGPGATKRRQIGGTANFSEGQGVFTEATATPIPALGRQTIVIQATMKDFLGNTGCTVEFKGSLGFRSGL